MSATEGNMQQLLQLSVASPSDILLQLVQQRHSLSSAMSATERNIQQLVELCRSRWKFLKLCNDGRFV
jgi:hypothetical protein